MGLAGEQQLWEEPGASCSHSALWKDSAVWGLETPSPACLVGVWERTLGNILQHSQGSYMANAMLDAKV